ncbi:Teichoic-acid-transporting ATPase [Tumidithrix helvetica PCC 7403]|uniref:ABC transporter ATP-binding protein n=1 Tax=Tumidithrix helvetica TaxID=3457545 RepID=UPI003C8A878F
MNEENNIVIAVKNLSKAYPIYQKPMDILKEAMTGKCYHDLFWALNDISFEIKLKHRVGIIGPNGSGKSTLLKILTGNLPPTSGSIKINGKISAMLSLTSSLNPEETGLSNIRFNLLLNGCNPSDVDKLTEEIVEFTELGQFIYAPVKTYSTGMNARLAFAITTAIKPEILVVDEVLSVGDAYFVGKAMKRMIDLCDQGKALLFVSHSTSSIQMLCDTVIWMENGTIRNMGEAEYIIRQYEEDYRRREDETTRADHLSRQNQSSHIHLSDIQQSIYKLRMISQENPTFKDTHFIRKIGISVNQSPTQEIPLTLNDTHTEEIASLDLLNSEWGRLYEKDGNECRILNSQSGKNKGGQILFNPSKIPTDKYWEVELNVESTSVLCVEKIGLEFTNYLQGDWESLALVSNQKTKDGWNNLTFKTQIAQVNEDQYKNALNLIEKNSKPDIEIIKTSLYANNEEVSLIKENQPFEIRVEILAHREVPQADIGIKITRSDGVYVFWQSSGFDDNNLINFSGSVTACFKFKENCIGSGVYLVSTVCSNGWDLIRNYPYSQVFSRQVSSLKFNIVPEFPILDFGIVNTRVPVTYIHNNES